MTKIANSPLRGINMISRFVVRFIALGLLPVFAFALGQSTDGSGIGQVALNMMEPVSLFSDFVLTGCFLIGGSFLFAAIIKYFEHRRSPLMVPISTVIFLLIAGILLILLPFLPMLSGTGMHYSLLK